MIFNTLPSLVEQSIVPYQAFATRDDHMVIAAATDAQFSVFANAIGRPEWANVSHCVSHCVCVCVCVCACVCACVSMYVSFAHRAMVAGVMGLV